MTPQLTNPQAHQAAHPDARINHVLEALRTAAPPAGLEQRIAARLAQAAEARQSSAPQTRPLITTDIATEPSIFTIILNAARTVKSKSARIFLAPAGLYTAAAALALLLALTTITILHHHTLITTAQSKPTSNKPQTLLQPTSLAQAFTATTTHAHRAFSFTPHSPIESAAALAPTQPDLDSIALAETRAPSRPAPPMPLTSQEHLLLAATRPGQPIQLAELDIARAPLLRAAAESREDARIRRYVRSLLAPFAVADALSMNSHPREISTTAPAPQPPSSLTN